MQTPSKDRLAHIAKTKYFLFTNIYKEQDSGNIYVLVRPYWDYRSQFQIVIVKTAEGYYSGHWVIIGTDIIHCIGGKSVTPYQALRRAYRQLIAANKARTGLWLSRENEALQDWEKDEIAYIKKLVYLYPKRTK